MKPCTAGRRRTRFFCALLAWALLGALLIGGTPPAQAVSLPRVEGLGAIVMDYQTGQVYFSREADTPRPAASMTKLMSLYLVFEEIEAGNLSTDSYITASEYAAQISSDPSYSGVEDLHAGDGYQVDDLLGLIMTASCNGSVIALAEHISGTEEKFVQRMNNKAEEWGIDAHFADCCGFEDEGNAVSPRAMATIAQRLIADYPRILHYSTLPSLTFHGKEFYNTNALLLNGTCPGIDGLKSGTTPGAGFCYTGTASRDGRRIITVVMNSWSYAMRMEDTRQMLEYGFARRSRAEAAWTSALETLEVDLSVEGGHLRPFTENLITATFSGMEGVEIPCTLSWSLNGRPIGEEAQELWLRNRGSAAVLCVPAAGAERMTVSLQITLPTGQTLLREAELPAVSGPAALLGRLGPAAAARRANTLQLWQGVCASAGNSRLPLPLGLRGNSLPGAAAKSGPAYAMKSFSCQALSVDGGADKQA
ncbi:MAG: D-alanyl-D-alanine carboxypeptidase [Flavonifractor sp.]|nr:D-alanyl-D-alanine carboxypeptidase [Flavonifractor sp.]